jgi:hypothetical protein
MGDSNPQREEVGSTGSMSRGEWERLPANPDLQVDLGYELFDLEAYETDDGVLVLPQDEDMLHDEAFIVASDADLVTLGE